MAEPALAKSLSPPKPRIPISEATGRILKFYPARTKPGRCDLAAGGLRGRRNSDCSYRELVGHRASEPTPDKPEFWTARSARPNAAHTLPLATGLGPPTGPARMARRPQRALCDYTALGLTVTWAEVIKIFPSAAAWARPAGDEAPPPQPDYRLPRGTTIKPQAIIGVIVDRHLYPEGLQPEIVPGTLKQQCDGSWEAACKANSVKLLPPTWPTFKAFIRSPRGWTSIDFD